MIEISKDNREEIEFWLECCADDESDPIHRVKEWRLERVPIAAFGCTFHRDELGKGWDLVEARRVSEDERDAKVAAWAKGCGGWAAATAVSPVIALRSGAGKYEKVDGWHRMRLASRDGETHVWCLVGLVD